MKQEVHNAEIDWEDFTFRYGKKDRRDELAASIRQYGIIDSPVLIKGNAKYKIFSGFNRLEAARDIYSSFTVEVLEKESEEIFKREVGKKLFNQRVGVSGRVKLCEIYLQIHALTEKSNLPPEEMIPGIPRDFFSGTPMFKLFTSLDSQFRDYLDEKDITFKIVRTFLSLSEKIRILLADTAVAFMAGKNNFKKLAEIILDIEQQGNAESVLVKLQSLEPGKGKEGFDELYRSLYRIRYPRYSEMEIEKNRIISLLKKPSVTFSVPDFFEGDEVILHVSLRKGDGLDTLAENIEGLDKKLVEDLLGLL